MAQNQSQTRIPIFPLQRVVFPDSVLRLQIFEQRYLEMISQQLSANQGFGVTLIRKGFEAGKAAIPYRYGTYVNIVDFDQKDNGLLMITCLGEKRFQIHQQQIMDNHLIKADVSWLDSLQERMIGDEQSELVALLSELSQHPQVDIIDAPDKWNELGFVIERLTEYMPISELQKQAFLETSDLDLRIAMLYQMLSWLK